MNPLLSLLQPYPFERLRQLLEGVTPNPALSPISLGMGEPKHPTPDFIRRALCDAVLHEPSGLASYPATAGEPALRQAFADWLLRRYGVQVDPLRQTLPVNGSREALFALTQTLIDPGDSAVTGRKPVVVCPNPFYQIYEGAALLAGAQPAYAPCNPQRNFAPDWDCIAPAVWERTQQMFVCSPGNPTGAVMSLDQWQTVFELSDRYGFVVASDECYSEIYFDDQSPPLGGLQAAQALGRSDFNNLIVLTSLSKRSNLPGLRSGFVAGDARLIERFLLYRTYHGCAMSPAVQAASIAAWSDESHVAQNRTLYRNKFAAVTPMLAEVLRVALPDAGFYLWADVGGCDQAFARALYAACHVTVLPGSFLARQDQGHNPGAGRVRLALVAETTECVEAARRMVDFVRSGRAA